MISSRRAALRTGRKLLHIALTAGVMLLPVILDQQNAAAEPGVVTEWTTVPSSIPEARLTDSMIARAPRESNTAPWRVRADGFVVWFSGADPKDRNLLTPALDYDATLLGKVSWFAHYQSDLGPYNELAGVLNYGRTGGAHMTIPFLPVDSGVSMRSARERWAMPKTLAEFSGGVPAPGKTISARGAGWEVSITSKLRGTRIPVIQLAGLVQAPGFLSIEQQLADGRVVQSRRVGIDGYAPAVELLEVEVSTKGSDQLRQLIPSGKFLGAYVPAANFDLLSGDFR
ncbi:acetoacetate decarboxylase family protein [Nocardia arthritidis]|uniref:Acetoacetate decarboxylase n=1 Tax=Nocardia arthritidis TaxID=228602 RepID=A0A6G9YLD5_9NOCA|nr:acetoacetate decarboxylase family protein [Nocardia arthritidis]QIS14022.1 hypothetical protein F5544_30895 [Nocardia arthritidis]